MLVISFKTGNGRVGQLRAWTSFESPARPRPRARPLRPLRPSVRPEAFYTSRVDKTLATGLPQPASSRCFSAHDRTTTMPMDGPRFGKGLGFGRVSQSADWTPQAAAVRRDAEVQNSSARPAATGWSVPPSVRLSLSRLNCPPTLRTSEAEGGS